MAMVMGTMPLPQIGQIIVRNILEIQIKIDLVVVILMQMVGQIQTQLQYSQQNRGMFQMEPLPLIQIRLNGPILIQMDMETIGMTLHGTKVEPPMD